MGSINLYKIDREKKTLFLQELAQKMKLKKATFLVSQNENGVEERFKLTLYLASPRENRQVS